jgi:hypothetical protein
LVSKIPTAVQNEGGLKFIAPLNAIMAVRGTEAGNKAFNGESERE